MAVISNLKRGFPARGLKVIGLSEQRQDINLFFIHSILRQAGLNAGLMTTVAYGVNENLKPQIFMSMTSQPIHVILNRIADMKKQGMEWLV